VNESEWLACTDPGAMLIFIRGKASERKLRLFSAASCRVAARRLPHGPSLLRAVEVAERLADGDTTDAEAASTAAEMEVLLYEADQDRKAALSSYHAEADSVCGCPRCQADAMAQRNEMNPATDAEFGYQAMQRSVAAGAEAITAEAIVHALVPAPVWGETVEAAVAAARQTGGLTDVGCTRLLRDLFANPFRPAPALDASWLIWQGGTVTQLARAAYDERRLPEGTLDPARLAVLADALEDAGCGEVEILGHLRGSVVHVIGCWALDLVLSKF
jgi:hypothetical protein